MLLSSSLLKTRGILLTSQVVRGSGGPGFVILACNRSRQQLFPTLLIAHCITIASAQVICRAIKRANRPG